MYLKKIVPLGKQKDVSLCGCDLISIFNKITMTDSAQNHGSFAKF